MLYIVNLEACLLEHRFQEPVERAELFPNVRLQLVPRPTESWIIRTSGNPSLDLGLGNPGVE